jgi:hypothetical protein
VGGAWPIGQRRAPPPLPHGSWNLAWNLAASRPITARPTPSPTKEPDAPSHGWPLPSAIPGPLPACVPQIHGRAMFGPRGNASNRRASAANRVPAPAGHTNAQPAISTPPAHQRVPGGGNRGHGDSSDAVPAPQRPSGGAEPPGAHEVLFTWCFAHTKNRTAPERESTRVRFHLVPACSREVPGGGTSARADHLVVACGRCARLPSVGPCILVLPSPIVSPGLSRPPAVSQAECVWPRIKTGAPDMDSLPDGAGGYASGLALIGAGWRRVV